MSNQVVVIHGGDSYPEYGRYINHLKTCEVTIDKFKRRKDWKLAMQENLGGFEVFLPQMPNSANAKYIEWKIWFERMLPFINDNAILLGHSLGGIFLAKYLAENTFPKKIKAVFLIAAPFNMAGTGDFTLSGSLEKITGRAGKIYLFHSEDDPVVPFVEVEKYFKALPGSKKLIFKDRGHFLQETFPEIIDAIKNL